MKKLVLLALSAITSVAFAGVTPSEIVISGTSNQAALIVTSSVSNTAIGADAKAQQNLASNSGNVTIKGDSLQAVILGNSSVTNTALADTTAQQNMSSNVGAVKVSGDSVQITALLNSTVSNLASGHDAMAVQNIASNNACFTCK